MHCPRHEVWLAARQPRLQKQSPLHPWINVWRSRPHWALAFESRYEAIFAIGANGFSPDSFAKPEGPWTEFEDDVRSARGGESDTHGSPFSAGSMASIVLSHEFAKLRRDVAAMMQIAPPHLRLDDRDIINYPRPKPVWIAERIVCLVIAVECIRLIDGRPALFPTVGPLVRAAQCILTLREPLQESYSL